MNYMKEVINRLCNRDLSVIDQNLIYSINSNVYQIINKDPLTKEEVEYIGDVLHISNILYNNTDRNILVLEDGIYDLLLEKYKKYNPDFQVGAEPIQFTNMNEMDANNQYNSIVSPFTKVNIDRNNMIFFKELYQNSSMNMATVNNDSNRVSKRMRVSSHKYPSLVGTLDKAKFVLDYDAQQKGVYNDSNVRIFERDFLHEHLMKGIINPNDITLVLELKYDGISIEAEVTDQVLNARTRGDTGLDRASDMTPILRGYQFPNAKGYNINPFGMKFEAIINNYNLQLLSQLTGKNYANPRNAIIGIFGGGDAAKYAEFITLVPLQTSLESMNRQEELEFMNRYYTNGEPCRYTIVRGNYESVLFQVRKFVKEAEMMRDVLPVLYDGVVVSYLDPNIRNILGRQNSINQYSIAIKFNAKKKLTRVRNITYTVGSNGTITPMIWYDPVEFMGMINVKSSGHSYERFKELNLRPGDVIQAEFTNDVMVYITKANVSENIYNSNPPFEFVTKCPECGTDLIVSESGKSVSCPNFMCPGRRVAKMVNMLKKLNFKGFSEERIKALGIYSFHELMEIDYNKAISLGEANCELLLNSINEFKNTPIADYNILGALGFTGIAEGKWKIIMRSISLYDIIKSSDSALTLMMASICDGLSYKTSKTVVKERSFFMNDLVYIYNNMNNIIYSKCDPSEDISSKKVIRFTGVRDKELMMQLCSIGHDASEGSVTKKTNILIVPYNGFDSTKVRQAQKYNSNGTGNILIIPLSEFKVNQSKYLDS